MVGLAGSDARNGSVINALGRSNTSARDCDWEQVSIERQNRPLGQDHGPLEDVLELSNISRPGITQ